MTPHASPAVPPEEHVVADAAAFLRAALEAAPSAAHRRLVVLPAAAVDGLAQNRPPTAFFASSDGALLTGWDAAETIAAEGHDLGRVRRAVDEAHRATTTLVHPALPDAARRPATWIGGLAFSPERVDDPVWAAFPPVCFVAPRWTHRVIDGVASLTLLLRPHDAADPGRVVEEYAALASGPRGRAHAATTSASAWRRPAAVDRGRWLAGTRAALEAIARGELRKVVLARHLDLDPGRVDVAAVLAALGRRFPTCTRFLLSRDGADFFGATPETLVERRGDAVRAEAMAGSCAQGEEAALRASAKDAREHALVVEDVVARLRTFCDPVTVPATTDVKRLANVSHLWTPIRGTLRRPVHVLELVAALHPTPAVAGTPTAAAVSLLRRAEAVSRGWFAAPFGWFDATGDGHFVVALRSCIRHADGVRVYAGAGIVRGSDPEREFDETALKMRAVLDTLHAVAGQPADRVG